MKILKHKTVPWPEKMTIQWDPMTVYITRHVAIQIEAGDTLKTVVDTVAKYLTEYDYEDVVKMVALWFALGERRAGMLEGKWTLAELNTDLKRKYSPKYIKERHNYVPKKWKVPKHLRYDAVLPEHGAK